MYLNIIFAFFSQNESRDFTYLYQRVVSMNEGSFCTPVLCTVGFLRLKDAQKEEETKL